MDSSRLEELVTALFRGWDRGPYRNTQAKLQAFLSAQGFSQVHADWVTDVAELVVDQADLHEGVKAEELLSEGVSEVVGLLELGAGRFPGTSAAADQVKAVLGLLLL